MTRSELRRLRAQYVTFITQLKPSYFITFNFGYLVTPINAEPRMKALVAAVERKAWGRDYCNFPSEQRLIVLGFPEHLDTNPHWHCLARLPPELGDILVGYGPTVWKKWVPRGQLDVQKIRSEEAVASYCTKRLHLNGSLEQSFLYGPDRR